MLKIALYIRSANSAVNKKSRLLQLVEYDKSRTFEFVLSSRQWSKAKLDGSP